MPNPKLETYKNKETGTVYDYTDAAAQAALADILDGTDIDSFGDVETALATKVDKVTGKGLSTNDYDDTAKGIVDNIQSNVIANTKLIKDTVGWSGKNKIWADYYDGRSKTMNGITATVNSDGSITFNGTSTGTFGFVIFQVRPSEFHKKFKVGDKCTILGCPANGSAFTYYLRLATDPWTIIGDDYGEGKNITIIDQSSKTWVKLMIGIDSGQTMNNVTFYPMICDTNILDKTFESPFSSTAFPRSEQAVLGAKNWLNIPKGTYTQYDVTIVVDDTGITLNGTCNAASGTKVNVNNLPISIDAKVADYKGVDVANNMSDDCYIWMSSPFSGGNINGKSWTVSTAAKVTGALSIKGGVTYTNFKIQPMIVLASDSDLSTYAPYAMTNKELTDAVTPVPLELTAGTNVDFNSNNKSCILGALKLIRTQIHITSALASGDLLLSANVKFVGFGSALLVNTNNGQIYGLLVTYGDDLLKIIAKGAIPEGYYAIDYCYV